MSSEYSQGYAKLLAEKHDDTFRRLSQVEPAAIAEILEALSEADVDQRRDLADVLVSVTAASGDSRSLSESEASQLIDALVDVAATSRVAKVEESALARFAATEAMHMLGEELSSGMADKFAALTEAKSVVRVAQREDLLAENDRVYIDSRTISDVRAIFDSAPSEEPIKVDEMILHTLRISFWEDGLEKSFSVTMRRRDVDNLASWMRRTQLKHETLETERQRNA